MVYVNMSEGAWHELTTSSVTQRVWGHRLVSRGRLV